MVGSSPGGSQRVLGDYGDWPRLIRGGTALGEIKEVFVDCGGPSGDCYLEPQSIPPGVDWDMWLGPAPWRPFHDNLINGGFRPFRDYSGGGMTDWGAHRFGRGHVRRRRTQDRTRARSSRPTARIKLLAI